MALLGTIGGLILGGAQTLLGLRDQERSQAIQSQGIAASAVAAREANKVSERNAKRNIKFQKLFAKHGVRWKTADAKAAGLHPYFALGGSTHSFSPVSVGHAADPTGSHLMSMGQDLSRAGQAKMTSGMRAMSNAIGSLSVERASLENKLLEAQIYATYARTKRDQLPPAMPTGVTEIDQKIIPGQQDAPHLDPGVVTDLGAARTRTGWAPVPSEQVKERIEDVAPATLSWGWRNYVLPNFGVMSPPFKAPRGKEWHWSYSGQEYRLRRKRPWAYR